ncbi:P-loop containing nucleoside triphosphate hydrolase protein, partial [Martensiomyces pterosporus]
EMEKVFKTVMLGGAKSGKTSLRNCFLYTNYTWHYTPTTNPDFVATYIALDSGELVAVQIWDTDGHAQDLTITNSLCSDADGIIFVYDGTSPESLHGLDRYFAAVSAIASSQSKRVPVLLVQAKSDLDRRVSDDEAKELARRHFGDQYAACVETSARTGNNVALAFRTIA